MDGDDAIAKRIEQLQAESDAANAIARLEAEAQEQYEGFWHAVRIGNTPDADKLTRLAKAIFVRHPDGSNAVQRLADEYMTDSENIQRDGFEVFHLKVLRAKRQFCGALIEASKAAPDHGEILRLWNEAIVTYPNLDAADVQQDLHSLRKVDVAANEAKRREALNLNGEGRKAGPRKQAEPQVDVVTWAVSLLTKHGANKAKIAAEIGVPRTSMVGKKWERFNKIYDSMG